MASSPFVLSRDGGAIDQILSADVAASDLREPSFGGSWIPSVLCNEELWPPGKGSDLAHTYRYVIFAACALYSPVILLGQHLMKSHKPFRLLFVTLVWNVILSALSFFGAMVLLFGEWQLLLTVFTHERRFAPATRAVVAAFTLTKALEFGDTFLLVLKKKPLSFLHCYHHVSVTLYCWHAQLVNVMFAHHFVFVNLCIHSAMYFYYAMATVFSLVCNSSPSSGFSAIGSPKGALSKAQGILKVGLRTARPYITLSQVVQMFFGLSLSLNALLSSVPTGDQRYNASLACAMYLSYCWLFSKFYFESYVKKPSKPRTPEATPKSGCSRPNERDLEPSDKWGKQKPLNKGAASEVLPQQKQTREAGVGSFSSVYARAAPAGSSHATMEEKVVAKSTTNSAVRHHWYNAEAACLAGSAKIIENFKEPQFDHLVQLRSGG